MTQQKSKAKAPAAAKEKPDNNLRAAKRDGETQFKATARVMLRPDIRHGLTAAQLFQAQMTDTDFAPGLGDYADAIGQTADKAANGDLAFASRMLAAQAMTLDSIFAEMARRMAINMGEYLGAMESYARIAMKAQAGSRAAIEALAKLHQPREQTVRHVHVNEGAQAVIADQFHHHTGGSENGRICEQPHASGNDDRIMSRGEYRPNDNADAQESKCRTNPNGQANATPSRVLRL